MKLLPTHNPTPNQSYIIIQDNVPRVVRHREDSARWEKLPDDPLFLKECFVNTHIAYELIVPPMKLTSSQFHALHHNIRILQDQIVDINDQPVKIGKVECTSFPETARFREDVRTRLCNELEEMLTFRWDTCF